MRHFYIAKSAVCGKPGPPLEWPFKALLWPFLWLVPKCAKCRAIKEAERRA